VGLSLAKARIEGHLLSTASFDNEQVKHAPHVSGLPGQSDLFMVRQACSEPVEGLTGYSG
jgi:hypothetical protein